MSKKKGEALGSKGDSSGTPPPPVVVVRRPGALSKLRHVRQEVAALYRDARTGRLDSREAARLVFILGTLGKLLETELIEARVDQLAAEVESLQRAGGDRGRWGRGLETSRH